MGFIVCFSLAGCYIQFNSQRELASKSGAHYLNSVACVLAEVEICLPENASTRTFFYLFRVVIIPCISGWMLCNKCAIQ